MTSLRKIATAVIPVVSLCLFAASCVPKGAASSASIQVLELDLLEFTHDLGETEETLIYDIVTVDAGGTESPYGTMELRTRKEGDMLLMEDTITLIPRFGGWVFVRNLSYRNGDLLRPVTVTIDFTASSQTTRAMEYSNGILSVNNQEPLAVDFSGGILVYNAMLRLVRLLDMDAPQRYTFRTYAEPFVFRMHDAPDSEPFVLENRPESSSGGIYIRAQMETYTTEIWVDEQRRPTRMVENLKDDLKAVFKLRLSDSDQ